MLRKKEFDHHIKELEEILDSEDEEFEEELDDYPEEDHEVLPDKDQIQPPAYGHTDGERVVGTTDDNYNQTYNRDFRDSLEKKLCNVLQEQIKKNPAGGPLQSIKPVKPIGTHSKQTAMNPDEVEETNTDKADAREMRQQDDEYNEFRNTIKGSNEEGEDEKEDGEAGKYQQMIDKVMQNLKQ